MKTLIDQIKATSGIINTKTSEFQKAKFMNWEQEAWDFLESILGEGFYPENAQSEWCDFAFLEGEMYCIFGTDSVMCDNAPATYVLVESAVFKSFIQECKDDANLEKERIELQSQFDRDLARERYED